MRENKGKVMPWGVIIFMMILLFPIGIYMMFVKIHNDKTNFISNGKAISRFGKFLVGFEMVFIALVIAGEIKMKSINDLAAIIAITLVVFLGGGIIMIHYGRKQKAKGRRYNEYKDILVNSTDGSIERIAAMTSRTFDEVCKDLQDMINDNILLNSSLDRFNGIIKTPLIQKPQKVVFGREAEKKEQKKAVECPSCGAVNTITDGYGHCEYCNSPIS